MITPLHFVKSAIAAFAFARHQLHFQLTCGLTVLAFSAASVAAQTTPVKSVPIRGGSQPFAITRAKMVISGLRFLTATKWPE
jgi:hypothetical protein